MRFLRFAAAPSVLAVAILALSNPFQTAQAQQPRLLRFEDYKTVSNVRVLGGDKAGFFVVRHFSEGPLVHKYAADHTPIYATDASTAAKGKFADAALLRGVPLLLFGHPNGGAANPSIVALHADGKPGVPVEVFAEPFKLVNMGELKLAVAEQDGGGAAVVRISLVSRVELTLGVAKVALASQPNEAPKLSVGKPMMFSLGAPPHDTRIKQVLIDETGRVHVLLRERLDGKLQAPFRFTLVTFEQGRNPIERVLRVGTSHVSDAMLSLQPTTGQLVVAMMHSAKHLDGLGGFALAYYAGTDTAPRRLAQRPLPPAAMGRLASAVRTMDSSEASAFKFRDVRVQADGNLQITAEEFYYSVSPASVSADPRTMVGYKNNFGDLMIATLDSNALLTQDAHLQKQQASFTNGGRPTALQMLGTVLWHSPQGLVALYNRAPYKTGEYVLHSGVQQAVLKPGTGATAEAQPVPALQELLLIPEGAAHLGGGRFVVPVYISAPFELGQGLMSITLEPGMGLPPGGEVLSVREKKEPTKKGKDKMPAKDKPKPKSKG